MRDQHDEPTIPAGAILFIEGDRAYYYRIDGRRIVCDYHASTVSNPRFDDLFEQRMPDSNPLPEKWVEISTPR